MSEQQPAIEVHNLIKHFGPKNKGIQALNDVSFIVRKGTVFCILGPNGAGKTTLIRILTTLMRPDHGSAKIEGYDIQTEALAVRHNIGVVPQDNHFDGYLSIWHNLTLHAQMHGLPRNVYEPELKRLLEKAGLYERRFEMTDKLSGGMQRRVALIRALSHRPKVLFLDEPTTGLDPQARRELWDTIENFKKFATIILTTHYMDEADILSDEIMMLNHGEKVLTGTPRQLKQSIATHNIYELLLKAPKAQEYAQQLSNYGVQAVKIISPDHLEFNLAQPSELRSILDWVPPEDIQRIGEVEPNLESVFLQVAEMQNKPQGAMSQESQP